MPCGALPQGSIVVEQNRQEICLVLLAALFYHGIKNGISALLSALADI